jgi:hypothetical protein
VTTGASGDVALNAMRPKPPATQRGAHPLGPAPGSARPPPTPRGSARARSLSSSGSG